MVRLNRDFYEAPPLEVARNLLGARFVRLENGIRLAGRITETEAYDGEEDLACHARAGRTQRTQVMYGEPGHAYVYFTYGVHWMLNFVTRPVDMPSAVLIRGVWPEEGLEVIAGRRNGLPREHWTDGPGKICQALNINGDLNGADLCASDSVLFVEEGLPIPDAAVRITPRIGISHVPEPWRSKPWRFRVEAADLG